MTFIVAGGVPISVASMGLNKNGNQAADKNQTTPLVNWVVRSGYPNTVLDANTLLVNAPGNVVIRTQVTLASGWGGAGGLWAQLVRNGAEVASVEFAQAQTVGTIPAQAITVAAGDRIAVNIVNGNILTGATVQGGTGTYVYFDPA
ncbi:hypothetical protein ACIA8C_11685 [Nocardia sp. NPDC051321]|uniref:hypothetical protein n=1 Tax=Nocardia sp. NPDC051321 TaxID=3364323 RepID=UPI0037A74ACB